MSPDERWVYFQVSFFHGFLELDLWKGRIRRVRHLPNLVPDTPREQYLLDSAHHGIAMNPRGHQDLRGRDDVRLRHRGAPRGKMRRGPLLKGGTKPYWVTPSADGRYCYISWTGTDAVSQISYATGRIAKTVKVGDHPQRIRNGVIARDLLGGLDRL